MTDSSDILTIERVACRYQQSHALREFSLSVREGEIVCLLGGSRCGKRALLKAVAGLRPVEEGMIAVSGQTISDDQTRTPPELRQVGMVFKDYALFPHLTAAENIAFGLYGQPPQAIAAVVAEMIELVKLEGAETRYPPALSDEERLRVAMARALACKPKVLLLDESFAAIDDRARSPLIAEWRLILKQRRIAAILATHNKEEAFAFADSVAVMDDNRIVQQGYPATLYQRPVSRLVADYLGVGNYLAVNILSDHQWRSVFGDHIAAHAHGQPIGSLRYWLIRPHDIALALDPDGVALVADRVFMGSLNHYYIKLDEQMIQVQSSVWFEPGQRVRLSVKTEQPILFPGA